MGPKHLALTAVPRRRTVFFAILLLAISIGAGLRADAQDGADEGSGQDIIPLVGEAGVIDPFLRHLTFYNDTPVTIWPMIQVPQDTNCKDLLGSKLLRIHVNKDRLHAGIPKGQSVIVALPKTWPCPKGGFYSAARIFVFTASGTELEGKLAARGFVDQVTQPYAKNLVTPICGPNLQNDPCWTGVASAAYALDSPAQLLEYTIISQNDQGKANADPNNLSGVPFLDFDVSYVDEAYLPAAMSIDTGAVQYMGSSLSYNTFNTRLTNFITQTKWPLFAAYAPPELQGEKRGHGLLRSPHPQRRRCVPQSDVRTPGCRTYPSRLHLQFLRCDLGRGLFQTLQRPEGGGKPAVRERVTQQQGMLPRSGQWHAGLLRPAQLHRRQAHREV